MVAGDVGLEVGLDVVDDVAVIADVPAHADRAAWQRHHADAQVQAEIVVRDALAGNRRGDDLVHHADASRDVRAHRGRAAPSEAVSPGAAARDDDVAHHGRHRVGAVRAGAPEKARGVDNVELDADGLARRHPAKGGAEIGAPFARRVGERDAERRRDEALCMSCMHTRQN